MVDGKTLTDLAERINRNLTGDANRSIASRQIRPPGLCLFMVSRREVF